MDKSGSFIEDIPAQDNADSEDIATEKEPKVDTGKEQVASKKAEEDRTPDEDNTVDAQAGAGAGKEDEYNPQGITGNHPLENEYDFQDAELRNCIVGDYAKQINVFLDKSSFFDSSREEAFPLPKCQYSTEFRSSLKNYQRYYKTHHWLIVVRNDDNVSYQFDMVKQLIQVDADRSYRVQTENVDCRDYIRHSDKLLYGKPTLTKVVVQDANLFFSFFKEAENVSNLTRHLKKCDNILIFVVEPDTNPDFAVKLNRHLEVGKHDYGIWTPTPEQFDRQVNLPLDELSIVERSTLAIAAWFDCLPYNLFQQLLANVLATQAENAKKASEDKNYPAWWSGWQQSRDQNFTKLGLANSPMPDEDFYTVRFSRPGEKNLHKERMINTAMFNTLEIWPAAKQVFFDNSNLCIHNTHWQSRLAPELATYLENLHRTGLLPVDSEFLITLYEEVRYAKRNDTLYFFRFAHLVKYLFRKDRCRDAVIIFIEQLQQLMMREERELITSINQDMKILGSLPKHMPKLAEITEKADQEIARAMFYLKDRIYASCFLLEIVLDADNPLFMERYNYVINTHAKRIYTDQKGLPTYGIYTYNLRCFLANTVNDLIGLSEQLTNLDENQDRVLLFQIARNVLFSHLDNKPSGLSKLQGLNYLYNLLMHERGLETIVQLLYPHTPQYQDYSSALIFTIRRMKCMLILQEQEDPCLDEVMVKLLRLCAKNISENEYSNLNDMCINLIDDSRQMLIDNTEKNRKKELIANKNASLFIKNAFKKR
ncbi:MAG: hypothetical protein KZQ76_00400 [Candidatus Thiodiazotropha sp. (ex Epidulcina cf. delphinae)]|nr:hypothetical protein [Candidatus Thiodiazotropha sp. (ex Epidulcina cf. delphinae)]